MAAPTPADAAEPSSAAAAAAATATTTTTPTPAPTPAGDPMYCAQQINIPPVLPDILKQYTKAAIKSQPVDLLAWSKMYFQALASHRRPVVSTRIDDATMESSAASASASASGADGDGAVARITTDQLNNLNTKFANSGERIAAADLKSACSDLSVPSKLVDEILDLGGFLEAEDSDGTLAWLEFVALASSTQETSIQGTMNILVMVLSNGTGKAGTEDFTKCYKFLRDLEGADGDETAKVVDALKAVGDTIVIEDLEKILSS